jgi:lysophospholipase
VTTHDSLTTIREKISPYELGSWDPALSTFAELPFIGTQLVNGLPTNVSNCVSGFDEAGFVIGTSASLFNVGTSLFH